MATGPGKYDRECTRVREETGAQAVVLIVFAGEHGSGFSVQTTGSLDKNVLADLLEHVAQGVRDEPGQPMDPIQ
jgi:hypothetical protein